jgi:hypothetical protein
MTNPHDVVNASRNPKGKSKKVKPEVTFYDSFVIKGQKLPDPKKHQLVSFLKSGIRIAGYVALFFSIEIAAVLLIVSELVGIYEELV